MGRISLTKKARTRKQSPISINVGTGTKRVHQCRPQRLLRPDDDIDTDSRLFACPLAQHNPSAVSRSCFQGWQSIPRLKEHLNRRHKRPSTKTRYLKEPARPPSCAGNRGCSASASRCTTCQEYGIWLSEKALRLLRCRSSDSVETWTQIYLTIYPNAADAPSPFLEHYDDPKKSLMHLIHDFARFLCDGLGGVLGQDDYSSRILLEQRLRRYIQDQEQKYVQEKQEEGSGFSVSGSALPVASDDGHNPAVPDCEQYSSKGGSLCSSTAFGSPSPSRAAPSIQSSQEPSISPTAVLHDSETSNNHPASLCQRAHHADDIPHMLDASDMPTLTSSAGRGTYSSNKTLRSTPADGLSCHNTPNSASHFRSMHTPTSLSCPTSSKSFTDADFSNLASSANPSPNDSMDNIPCFVELPEDMNTWSSIALPEFPLQDWWQNVGFGEGR